MDEKEHVAEAKEIEEVEPLNPDSFTLNGVLASGAKKMAIINGKLF